MDEKNGKTGSREEERNPAPHELRIVAIVSATLMDEYHCVLVELN